MVEKTLEELSIRDGVVLKPDTGYLLACDLELEDQEIPHAYFFELESGKYTYSSLNFNADTMCIASLPQFALVVLSIFGEFGINTLHGKHLGNLFEGQRKRKKYGSFRVVSGIAGKAYAAGHRGIVYRLEDQMRWVQVDHGLPTTFDITAIDGFSDSDIYAVGYKGSLWHFNGSKWSEIDLPTNINFTTVKCAGDKNVYVAGYDGILAKGREHTWEILAEDETTEVFWDLEWFDGNLYLSTMLFTYRLDGNSLDLVHFDGDPPATCYHLSAANGVMWSIGAMDVMSFDGNQWTRIV